ncbi:putative 2OG-Fe(II) oxygenase superfamily protein [Lyophyllum shimeji]|uniref:2OG-Fe(II) oxygenase superfamily protein n=1 Tax=Lyophyllum shimeji TaxID=47721 RepID=A0A9P3PV91_LYOSH|nr:putative 2OG-Fe(II) oxygenase superfamily protein [Lyophyllum shimeji]
MSTDTDTRTAASTDTTAATDHPRSSIGPSVGRGTTSRRRQPELGVGDTLGAGDSYLVADVLPADLAKVAFERLKEEVKWNVMHHRGGEVPRLVAVEGEVGEDGSFPLYRHPADESPPLSPFSPTVARIRDHVQQVLEHPVNHVLIQHYRSGKDYISEHSDKTIDIVRGSNIVNVSLGAQRVMTLRLKAPPREHREQTSPSPSGADAGADGSAETRAKPPPRQTQRIPLPHNSMFVMGPETNRQWLHGIHHDNRALSEKSEAELFEGMERISLTFRHIGTFLTADGGRIFGQGARGKTREEARPVVFGGEESERLIAAFGEENYRNDFDWERNYGEGFDVLHFKAIRDDGV